MTTLRDLIWACRTELDDLSGDVSDPCAWENDDTGLLWKNAELTRFANQAEREFCRRRPIHDQTTTAICSISLTTGDPQVTIDKRVEYIERVKLDGQTRELTKKTKEWMDYNYDDWEAETGEPVHYIEGENEYTFRVWPIPTSDMTGTLTVGRLPLNAMTWAQRAVVSPEIKEKEHDDLVLWMCHLALRKRDSETYNKEEADRYEGEFARAVGPRKSAFMSQRRRKLRNLKRRTRAQPR
jgi:hypothetical protein